MHDERLAQRTESQLLADDTFADVSHLPTMPVYELEANLLATVTVDSEPEASVDATAAATEFSAYESAEQVVFGRHQRRQCCHYGHIVAETVWG